MADAQIVHLYHRRLYNSDIDRLLRDEDKSSKTYRLFALGDESRLLDPSKRRQIIKKGLGLKLLRDISEGECEICKCIHATSLTQRVCP